MTAKIIPFRRQELERTAFGRRHLTPEQRAQRSAMSKRPRRSKNGTPEERLLAAGKAAGATIGAAAAGTLAPAPSQEELRALYDQLSPEHQVIAAGLIRKLNEFAN
jgi:hypothetical protein